MSRHKSTNKIHLYASPDHPDAFDRIKAKCALKLQPYSTHTAGGGSYYVYAGDVKIRFADHEETSSAYERPDYNIIDGDLDDDTIEEILDDIDYPELAKKTVMAKHLGLTVPKLKPLLAPHESECYEDVCENEAYPNTYTEYVVVSKALQVAQDNGIATRLPVAFGCDSEEDYCGSRW